MSVGLSKRRSAMKTEVPRTVLIAIPNSVEFRNYESNKLYQKVVSLRNVSASSVRFRLEARPVNSPFAVTIEWKGRGGGGGGVPPGMHAKLLVSFRCDTLEEPKETLVVNVQQGRSLIIKLRGYRDPPILRVFNIPYLRYSREESHAIARDPERWTVEIPFERTHSREEFIGDTSSDTPGTLSTESAFPRCRTLKSFDCGACLVGEQVTLFLIVKNIGGEGRFFVMSEIDWCSMHVEDITDENTLVLTSFAMRPAYFTLKPQECTRLHLYFFPDAHGTHVETLYAICDNCSVITLEIIGDGVERL